MQRIIVQTADVSGAALADLKSWLGISRPDEDELLTDLLQASLSLCEAFIGQAPLAQTVEERFSPQAGLKRFTSRPVQSLVSVDLVADDGTLSLMGNDQYGFSLEAARIASLVIGQSLEGQAIAARVIAGIASDWNTLPSALKQGVIRMAAYHYRDREAGGSRAAPPPSSVAALWRPWRSLRLA